MPENTTKKYCNLKAARELVGLNRSADLCQGLAEDALRKVVMFVGREKFIAYSETVKANDD